MTCLEALGGEAGCRRLSREFYSRVAKDPVLRPLFPFKTLRCATEEFASFLIQFLGGDEDQTQHRWWLSLRESHARFQITPEQRSAWLKHMNATLEAFPAAKDAFRPFFQHSSAYVIGREQSSESTGELGDRWSQQLNLDETLRALTEGRTEYVLSAAARFSSRRAVFVGLLSRMIQSGEPELIAFVIEEVTKDPTLGAQAFGGRPLLHRAAEAGCVDVVSILLKGGVDPNILDRGGHSALYAVANGCASDTGPELVRLLVRAGADVNALDGVMRTTPLHMAARRGFVGIARTLIELGADKNASDRKGVTPLQRALNCRRPEVAEVLRAPLIK